MEAPEKIYLKQRNKIKNEVVRCSSWYESIPECMYGSVEYIRKDVVDDMLKTAEDHAYFAGSEAMREKVTKEVKGIIDSLQKRCKPNPTGTLEECIAAAQIEALKLVIE